LVFSVFSTAAVDAAGALADAGADADERAAGVAVDAAGEDEDADEAQPAASRVSAAAPATVAIGRLIRVFIAFSLVG
jgi:hypothetical protein